MTISSYKVDSVLRAYNKQNNPRISISDKLEDSSRYQDVVTLSSDSKKNVYDKISYSLVDIILRNNQTK